MQSSVTQNDGLLKNVHLVRSVTTSPAERGGQRRSLSGGPGTQGGGGGFRIVWFRMQNSSPQTTACGRDDDFFISGRNSNICGRYDHILLITIDVVPKFEHLRRL